MSWVAGVMVCAGAACLVAALLLGRRPGVPSRLTAYDPELPKLEGDALDQAIRDAMRPRPWEGW